MKLQLFKMLLPLFSFFVGVVIMQFNSEPVQTAQEDKTRPFMRAKLVSSQSVLDGLVTEDLGLIRRGAAHMKQMSQALQWPQADDKVYQHYGSEFRRQCDRMIKLAEANDLEGAHHVYLQMTTTCINCHNYVRGAFRIERDASRPQGPVRLIPTEWKGQTYRRQRAPKGFSR